MGDFMFVAFHLRIRTYLIINIATTQLQKRGAVSCLPLQNMTRKLLSLCLMTALTVAVVTFEVRSTEKKLTILIFAENNI
jgi:hypothetical protein